MKIKIGGTILEVVEIEEADMGMLQQRSRREKHLKIDMKIAKKRTQVVEG